MQPSSTKPTITSQPAASVSEVREAHMRPLPITHLDCHSGVFTDMKLLLMCFIIQPSSTKPTSASQPASSVSEVSRFNS